MTGLERAAFHVLNRMSGCADKDCSACKANRDAIVDLIDESRNTPSEKIDEPRLRELAR